MAPVARPASMRTKLTIALAAMLLAGCTTTQVGQDRLAQRDPLEGFNRTMWGVNQGVDKVVLKPVSSVYRAVTPAPARRGLSRVFANLSEPWSMINNLLQGKPGRAARNLGRFVVNTTVGVGGLADHATKIGIAPAPEDFGQTMAAWGMNAGPYLVLPILGPSTLRDGIGSGVAFGADPYRVCMNECGVLDNTGRLVVTGSQIVIARSDMTDAGADKLLDTSADPYATARSAYLQRRRAAILNQEEGAASDDAAIDAALSDIDDANATSGAPTSTPDATAPAPTPTEPGTPAPETPATDTPPPVSLPDADAVPPADPANPPR